jgi:hypothetical protein
VLDDGILFNYLSDVNRHSDDHSQTEFIQDSREKEMGDDSSPDSMRPESTGEGERGSLTHTDTLDTQLCVINLSFSLFSSHSSIWHSLFFDTYLMDDLFLHHSIRTHFNDLSWRRSKHWQCSAAKRRRSSFVWVIIDLRYCFFSLASLFSHDIA